MSNEALKDGLRDALERLALPGRFGDAVVNVGPAESPTFATVCWQGMAEFRAFLRTVVPTLAGHEYGDVVVRLR